MSSIPNLLMKRVIIMRGFCDLIYEASNSAIQFVEQQRVYLENLQKRLHQYWSIASTTTTSTSSCADEDRMTETRSSPTIERSV